jgi:glycosyltransferase involved in cell wall biosynthesis
MLNSESMAKLVNSISFFFPCYNEETSVGKVAKDALSILAKIAEKYEVILVDDGSKDKTGEIADELAKKNKHVEVIHHSPNRGYGGALISGFYAAKYDWIATVDADGQFDVSEITKLIERAKCGYDVVIGYRLNRQDPLIRKINGFGWTMLANLFFGINVRDVDCSFKLVNRQVIKKISHLTSMRGGMISPELLAKAKMAGFKIASDVGVHHYPREKGHNTGADFKVIIKSFIDLFRLWNKLRS